MTKITSSYATWPLTYIVEPALKDEKVESFIDGHVAADGAYIVQR